MKRIWNWDLIDKLGLPNIFTDIIPPGSVGSLVPEVVEELGGGEDISVVAVGSHDTASAVASVPASSKDFVYISSGTWSLMGVEIDQPIINLESASLSFTNEGGVANRIRFLKNIMGLWLVQECRRQWQREGEDLSFGQLAELAKEAKPFRAFVDPDHESFVAPGDMPARIQDFCRNTNQPVPETKGEIIRCITESLALKYRVTMESLEQILGRELSVLHIVMGVSRMNSCVSLPDATASGSSLVLWRLPPSVIHGSGHGGRTGGQPEEIRACVARSFPQKEYIPQNTEAFDGQYQRFKELLS